MMPMIVHVMRHEVCPLVVKEEIFREISFFTLDSSKMELQKQGAYQYRREKLRKFHIKNFRSLVEKIPGKVIESDKNFLISVKRNDTFFPEELSF